MRVIFLTAIFLLCSLEGKEVRDILRTIPAKDKEKIEQLFSYLVQRDSLGYVLFGDTKPAAVASIPIVCNYVLIPPSFTKFPLRYQQNLKKCWAVWGHYRQRFKHPNIIICEEHDRFRQSSFLQLFFIDKRKFEALLEHYCEDFAEVLGENFSPKKFIYRVEQKRNSMTSRLKPVDCDRA